MNYVGGMSTLTAILNPSPDGTLYLPLPAGWQPQQAVRVRAVLEPVLDNAGETAESAKLKGFGCLRGLIWMAPDFDEPLEDFGEYSA